MLPHLLLTPTRRRLQNLMPARLVKSADKALTTKVFSAPSLDAAAWMAPVINASNVEKHDFAKPCVVACSNEDDRSRTLS